jgi:hypothetical protein
MDRWDRIAAFVALVGLASVALALSGVSPSDGGGGATYYLDTEYVANESVPANATAVPFEESPDPVVDALTASLAGNVSTAEIRREHRELIPDYVEYQEDVYRVDTWHVDHSVHLSWYAALAGGAVAFVVGAVGFAIARNRTAPGD